MSDVIQAAAKAMRSATVDLKAALDRMKQRSKTRVNNLEIEITRLRGLLNRETVTSARRTKLLRQLGTAERQQMQEKQYLKNLVDRLKMEAEKALAEDSDGST